MLAIGTPYKENSISAIARTAAARRQLQAFYTTLYTARFLDVTHRLRFDKVRASLEREFRRRAFDGVPRERVKSLAGHWDVALLAMRRLRFDDASSHYVFHAKDRFDDAMAKRVASSPAQAVIGMWGSCARTFRAAHRLRRFTVMNYVNSHPCEQNRLMREVGGAPKTHSEYIPPHVIKRVEEEMAEADLLLVPSQFVARQLQARGVSPGRIVVEPYGVDLRAFSPPPESRDYRSNRRLRVLCVAMISYRKGTKDVVAAARRMEREADFHLMGPVLERDLLKHAPPNLTYHGIKVQAEVAAAMRTADVLVLASIEDACPLVILEAMATALPVVTTDHVGGCEALLEGGLGLIYPAGNAEALVSALRHLHAEPLVRELMGRKGRAHVATAASWESYAHRVLDHIDAFVSVERP